MNRIVIKFFIALGALVSILLFIAALWLWDPLSQNLQSDEILQKARLYNVEIIRDEYGVPHIFGDTDADTAFGLAYAQAEDDFETVQEVVAATRGVLSRYRGSDAAPTDYLISLLNVWQSVDEGYEKQVPDHIKAIANAYAAGINLYAARHPDETWTALAPFTAQDIIAGFVFKTPLFYGLDETLLALFGDDYQQQIALDPASDRQSWTVGPRSLAKRGSNAIAVSPERSPDKKTRLLINSHQPFSGPVAWYEAHLASREGLNITGGTFPGAPVILHGFNPYLGWANTVNKPDLVDTYILKINPENSNQYLLDGEWVGFEQSRVRFRVKLFGPFALPVNRKILHSKHGPVIQSDHGTYAIRYSGRNELRQLEQYYRLNKSTSMEEFLEAMAMNALPSINYIYADHAGNIGFIYNAQYPDRNDDWDWSKDLPGDRSDLIWENYRPFTQVPIIINPASGLLWNSNNTPMAATDGDDNLRAENFPQSMGLQTNMTNRAHRMVELTGKNQTIDKARLLEIKFDTQYSQKSLAVEIIKDVLMDDRNEASKYKNAREHLRKWDFRTNIENHHAALGVFTVLREITAEFTKQKPPERSQAFRDAVDLLVDNFGTVDISWGEVNRLVRGSFNQPVSGAPDILRAIYPAEIREDGKLFANAGDTWIALVEWDEDGNQSADLVHQYGSATLNETSPHYADQAPLFAKEQFRPALLKYDDIVRNATRRYSPIDQ